MKYVIPPEKIISGNFCGETSSRASECHGIACHSCYFSNDTARNLGIDRGVIRASFYRIWEEVNHDRS